MDMRFSMASLLKIKRGKANDHYGANQANKVPRCFAEGQDGLQKKPISACPSQEKTMTFFTLLTCASILGVVWTLNVLTVSVYGWVSVATGAIVVIAMQIKPGLFVKNSLPPERLQKFARTNEEECISESSRLDMPGPAKRNSDASRTGAVLWSLLLPKLTCPACYKKGQIHLISTLHEYKNLTAQSFSANCWRTETCRRKTLEASCQNCGSVWCGVENLRRIAGIS